MWDYGRERYAWRWPSTTIPGLDTVVHDGDTAVTLYITLCLLVHCQKITFELLQRRVMSLFLTAVT